MLSIQAFDRGKLMENLLLLVFVLYLIFKSVLAVFSAYVVPCAAIVHVNNIVLRNQRFIMNLESIPMEIKMV